MLDALTGLLFHESRYLVPADLTVGQFVYVVRKRIKLSAEKAIFVFVNNVLPPTGEFEYSYDPFFFFLLGSFFLKFTKGCLLNLCSVSTAALMSAIYEENKDEDGFLYMTYSGENTFGSLQAQ